MKKLILGAFFTAALVVAGTTNANAQATKAVKAEKVTNAVLKEKATVNKKATLKTAPVSNAKAVPAKLKPISKPSAAKVATPKAAATGVKPNAMKAGKPKAINNVAPAKAKTAVKAKGNNKN
jgi:hypothetical protein